MDQHRFDQLAVSLAATRSRRQAMRLMVGGFAAAVGLSRLAVPLPAGAQADNDCGPDDPPCVRPGTTQMCCVGVMGYICTENKLCCQPDHEVCAECCCDNANDQFCNPDYVPGNPDTGRCCLTREKKLKVTQVQLNDIDNVPLIWLSAAEHTYFGGNTRIHGTITVKGAKRDTLQSLELEILQNGSVVATARLASSVRDKLLTRFGSDEQVKIGQSQLLFELPSDEAANVNGSSDGFLVLRIKARSKDDGEITHPAGATFHLVRYTNGNRYGGRDPKRGGDDWVLPSVKDVLEHFGGNTWGDISNMNGGSFAPDHKGHTAGNEADGHYVGYNYIGRGPAAAATMLSMLRDTTYGHCISRAIVSYVPERGDPFWDGIRNEQVRGAPARNLIVTDVRSRKVRGKKQWGFWQGRGKNRTWVPIRRAAQRGMGHTTHFHWVVTPGCEPGA